LPGYLRDSDALLREFQVDPDELAGYFFDALPNYLQAMLPEDPMVLTRPFCGGHPLGHTLVVAAVNNVLPLETTTALLDIVDRNYHIPPLLHLFHPSHPAHTDLVAIGWSRSLRGVWVSACVNVMPQA
jgi:hypothetical protein